jgi:ABC-type transport system substrate-binding protein
MRRIQSISAAIVFTILAFVFGFGFVPGEAKADIPELVIGIGIDADTLNPQEQTTTLPQNMCDLIYDTLLYQDPEGKLHPRSLSDLPSHSS